RNLVARSTFAGDGGNMVISSQRIRGGARTEPAGTAVKDLHYCKIHGVGATCPVLQFAPDAVRREPGFRESRLPRRGRRPWQELPEQGTRCQLRFPTPAVMAGVTRSGMAASRDGSQVIVVVACGGSLIAIKRRVAGLRPW